MNFSEHKIYQAIHCFLAVYLRGLEQNTELLKTLASIDYQQDEANTDKPAKIVIRDFMNAHPQLGAMDFSEVTIVQDTENYRISLTDLQQVRIEKAYIPEELSQDIKHAIKQAKNGANYTNPDIYVDLIYQGNKYSISIEVKSTKDNKIPGSSVQQIDPFEWVIFIKRKNATIELTTGMYLNSITNRLPFPDRSPRPEVAFNTLKQWNDSNIHQQDNQLILQYDPLDIEQKSQILLDWKQKLVTDWLEIVQKQPLSSRKWFDDTLILFAKQLLDYYDDLEPNQKMAFYQSFCKHRLIHSFGDMPRQHRRDSVADLDITR